jgi:hypothetical protein
MDENLPNFIVIETPQEEGRKEGESLTDIGPSSAHSFPFSEQKYFIDPIRIQICQMLGP